MKSEKVHIISHKITLEHQESLCKVENKRWRCKEARIKMVPKWSQSASRKTGCCWVFIENQHGRAPHGHHTLKLCVRHFFVLWPISLLNITTNINIQQIQIRKQTSSHDHQHQWIQYLEPLRPVRKRYTSIHHKIKSHKYFMRVF